MKRILLLTGLTLLGTASVGLAADAAATYDGTYTGTVDLRPSSNRCKPGGSKTITISRGNVSMPTSGTTLTGQVTSDGSLSGTVQAQFLVTLKARIDGKTLVGQYGDGWCIYDIRLVKTE